MKFGDIICVFTHQVSIEGRGAGEDTPRCSGDRVGFQRSPVAAIMVTAASVYLPAGNHTKGCLYLLLYITMVLCPDSPVNIVLLFCCVTCSGKGAIGCCSAIIEPVSNGSSIWNGSRPAPGRRSSSPWRLYVPAFPMPPPKVDSSRNGNESG